MIVQVAQVAAFLIAVAFVGIGLQAFAKPTSAARGYGLPVSDAQSGFVAAAGVRDIVVGALLFMLIATESPTRLLGVLLLLIAIIPLGDIWVLRRARVKSGRAYLIHTGGAVAIAACGFALAWW